MISLCKAVETVHVLILSINYAGKIACVFPICPLLSFKACVRMCQNEGVLDVGTCTCDCAGGFSGANCESECNVKDTH